MFELHGTDTATVSFEMGLNVDEATVMTHVKPNVLEGSGTGGSIDKMLVKSDDTDFTTPDGMKFQFAAAAHDDAGDANHDVLPSA